MKDQKITLSAKSKDRRYYKSLNLPKVVIPDEMHTKFKNGVLEIKLKKAETTTIGRSRSNMPHKLRKIRKFRGSRTQGYGRIGQHRDSGSKGNRKVGRHKHLWSKVVTS